MKLDAATAVALIRSTQDAVVVVALDDTIVGWNLAAERLYGYAASEAIGRQVSLIVPSEQVWELEASRERLRARLPVSSYDTVRTARDGRRVEVGETLSAITDADGRVIGLSMIAHDIAERRRREELLRVSEQRHRLLVQHAPFSIHEIDLGGRITDVNPAGLAMLGSTDGNVRPGMRYLEAVAEIDRPRIAALLEQALRGDAAQFEFVAAGSEGRVLASSLIPLVGPDGRVQRLMGVTEDITERKRSERELQISEERYRQLVTHANDVIFYIDLGGRFTFVNQTAVHLMKYSKDELLGRHFLTLVRADHRNEIEAFYRRQIEERIPSTYHEFAATAKDGTELWFGQMVQLVLEQDRIVAAHAIARDITERKRAEEALRQSEASYRALVQGASYGIFRSTADGVFLDVNPALVTMLGYDSATDLLNATLPGDIYADPGDGKRFIEQYAEVSQIEGVEMTWRRKDGTRIVVHLSGGPMRDERGGLQGFQMMVENVTERRNLEEQLRQAQKLEAIGRLAGGIAHDFNNLLTVIIGSGDLLSLQIAANDPKRKEVEEILKAADSAASLIRQLLAFSRKQVLQPQLLDLNVAVARLEGMLHRLLGESIRVQMALDPTLPPVRADPGQIEQVLLNLAVNARDAMPKGGTLTFQTRHVPLENAETVSGIQLDPGRYVMLSVSDSGSGMDETTRAHVFEPFFTTRTQGRGTGLGLATVYGIVKQSGGSIAVDSDLGRGSTFTICLPATEIGVQLAQPKEQPPLAQGGETVLLVDDEDAVRGLLRRTLRTYGYRVLEARHPEEALAIAERRYDPIHLLVIDVMVPQISGRALADRIHGLHPEAQILYVSGYTRGPAGQRGVPDTGAPILRRPFTPTALAEKVREILDGGAAAAS